MSKKEEKTPFHPYGSTFLVEYEVVEKRGDLWLPESAHAQKGIVKVLAKGPRCEFVEVGDWVLLSQGGQVITVNGETYGIVPEYAIYGKFEEKPDEDSGVTATEGPDYNIKLDKTEAKAKAFEEKVMKK